MNIFKRIWRRFFPPRPPAPEQPRLEIPHEKPIPWKYRGKPMWEIEIIQAAMAKRERKAARMARENNPKLMIPRARRGN